MIPSRGYRLQVSGFRCAAAWAWPYGFGPYAYGRVRMRAVSTGRFVVRAVREPPLHRLPVTVALSSEKPDACSLMTLNNRVAPFFEDAEGAGAQGHEVSIAIADLGLDGGDAARAVDDLGGAGDPTLPHGAEEVNVEADGRRPQADERGHREPHRVVYERGVDPAVQRPVAVEVDALHVYVTDGLPWLDLLDLALDVPRESNPLVEVPREAGQLVFV